MDRMHQPKRRARPGIVAWTRGGEGQRAAAPLALAVMLSALVLTGPAYPQWRAGQAADPAAALHTRAGNLAGYAQMVDTWGDRPHRAVAELAAQPPADPQEGAMSRPRMHLLDVAQTAWVVIKNVPAEFGDRSAYEAADRQFHASITEMRVASTPTPEALEEARKILAALERLEGAAVEAARRAAR